MDNPKLNPNLLYLRENVKDNRWTLLQGGTRSGKTRSVIDYIIELCLIAPMGLEIDICRNTNKALKATVWKDFQDVLADYGLYSENHHNKTDQVYRLNGNNINYYGADDPQKIHGRSRDILWLNECNQIEEDTVDQLTPRTRNKIIGDYNPAIGDDHWLDPYIVKYPPIITTYRDNPWLTDDQVADIESKKGKKYWWAVYGQGTRAKREGVIFENWEYGEFDYSLPYFYGLDFGYVNDPDACVKVSIDEKRGLIYVDEVFYEYGQTINELANIIKGIPKAQMVADSAEQRLIQHLSSKCQRNIQPVRKGPGSVLNGIRIMEDYKIIITKQSQNTKKELNNYSWSDKGKQAPIDDWNHSIDAIRYVVSTYANRQVGKQRPIDNDFTKWNKGESTGARSTPW